MKPRIYNYYKLCSKQMPSSCEFLFKSLDELKRFADTPQPKDIFILTNEDDDPDSFGIIQNGIMLHHPAMGFKNLEDFQAAKQGKFPGAAIYYEAILAGYFNYEDYKIIEESGINDKAVFEKLKQEGYIAGFKDYSALVNSGADLPQIEALPTAFDLYTYANKNGFPCYDDFKEAFVKGFTTITLFNVAFEQGFSCSADYEDAKQRGFRNYNDLKFANENQIRDVADFKRMIDINMVICEDCTFDHKLMLSLLSKLEQGKKISINKLTCLFQKTLDEYRYTDNGEMPGWFTISFNGNESIIYFLQNNPEVKKYGSYDTDGEFFHLNFAKDRRVVIDCSNVAYNSNGNEKAKPFAANVIRLVHYLKKEGFNDLHLIADASLKHRIVDTENISILKESGQYMEAPASTSADAFIIEFVKRHNCKYITNDTFREWKNKDLWLAENYKYYHRTYIMNENEVLIPDLN